MKNKANSEINIVLTGANLAHLKFNIMKKLILITVLLGTLIICAFSIIKKPSFTEREKTVFSEALMGYYLWDKGIYQKDFPVNVWALQRALHAAKDTSGGGDNTSVQYKQEVHSTMSLISAGLQIIDENFYKSFFDKFEEVFQGQKNDVLSFTKDKDVKNLTPTDFYNDLIKASEFYEYRLKKMQSDVPTVVKLMNAIHQYNKPDGWWDSFVDCHNCLQSEMVKIYPRLFKTSSTVSGYFREECPTCSIDSLEKLEASYFAIRQTIEDTTICCMKYRQLQKEDEKEWQEVVRLLKVIGFNATTSRRDDKEIDYLWQMERRVSDLKRLGLKESMAVSIAISTGLKINQKLKAEVLLRVQRM